MYSLGKIKSLKYGDFQSLSLKETDILDGNQVYLKGEFLGIALKIWKNSDNKRHLCIVDETLGNKLNKLQEELTKEYGHAFRPFKDDSTIYAKIRGKDISEIHSNNYIKLHVFSVFKNPKGQSFLQIQLVDFGPYYNIIDS